MFTNHHHGEYDGKVENRGMNDAAGQRGGSRAEQAAYRIEHKRAGEEHGDRVDRASGSPCRQQGYTYQQESAGKNLRAREPRIQIKSRQHPVSGSGVILAVHERNGQEMRKLPKEQDAKQQPRLPADRPRPSGPANQGWHSARDRTQKCAQGGSTLERGVDPKIGQQGGNGQKGRESVHRERKIQSPGHTQQRPEAKRLPGANSARR